MKCVSYTLQWAKNKGADQTAQIIWAVRSASLLFASNSQVFSRQGQYHVKCHVCDIIKWTILYIIIALICFYKVSKGAKIRNQYNQVPHLTQDTNGKGTNSQLDTTNESQEVSPFPSTYEQTRSKIYLLTDGLNLENGILIEAGSNESDVLACWSTISFPWIPIWLGIKQRTISLLAKSSWHFSKGFWICNTQ